MFTAANNVHSYIHSGQCLLKLFVADQRHNLTDEQDSKLLKFLTPQCLMFINQFLCLPKRSNNLLSVINTVHTLNFTSIFRIHCLIFNIPCSMFNVFVNFHLHNLNAHQCLTFKVQCTMLKCSVAQSKCSSARRRPLLLQITASPPLSAPNWICELF